ncbi:hypothetical protein [Amycolatopsis sp. lyj-23]|uniref:hypothetical protein n=1 Tax=Amycolatopsis sp. lyj-23 TaxID=2789283 RepID=UPI0039787CAA
MTPAAGDLRPTSAPTRVAELLLPTVLTLLSRGPATAASFSILLPPQPTAPGTRLAQQGTGVPSGPPPKSWPSSGTRVTGLADVEKGR